MTFSLKKKKNLPSLPIHLCEARHVYNREPPKKYSSLFLLGFSLMILADMGLQSNDVLTS